MKNLKKILAVVLVVVMMAITMVPAFAADSFTYAKDADTLNTLGLFKGVGADGAAFAPDLGGAVNREMGITILVRMLGKESAAAAMTDADATAALAKFTDASKISDWAKKNIAYAVKNKLVEGMDATTMGPAVQMQGKMFATILLRNLGHDVNYDTACATLQEKGGLTAAQATLFNDKALIRDDIVGMMIKSLNATYKTGETVIAKLVNDGAVDKAKATSAYVYNAPTAAPVSAAKAISALTAKTAKSLEVKLDGSVADTAKVVFTVTRDSGVAVTLTATWSADKTTAVLAQTTNLVVGDYKVAVKNDTTDLGSKTVTVAAEKIGKIEIVGGLLNRRSDIEGIASYKVSNQYGDDITSSSLASNITWNSSLGKGTNGADISADKGLVTVTKNDTASTYMNKLKDYATIVVTAFDTESGITMSQTINVSTTIGDIQSVKLLGISNKDKKTVIEKGSSDVFYLDYEIKDSLGNLVTDYAILNNPDAFRTAPRAASESSIAYVTVVQDPANSKKALLEIKQPTTPNAGIQVITAFGIGTGKSASFNVEVKEGSSLAQLTMTRPATDVAVNDGWVEIPYTAVDSNGNALTMYKDIAGKVTYSTGGPTVKEEQNPNGTYRLMMNFGSTKTTYVVTATVSNTTSVKMSTMTVVMKDSSYPYDITGVSVADVVAGVVYGASGTVATDKVTIVDQFGRAINLKHANNFSDGGLTASSPDIGKFYTGKDGLVYYVAMSSSDTSVMTVSGSNYTAADGKTYALISGNKSATYSPVADVDGKGTKSATLNFSLRKVKSGTPLTLADIYNTANYTEVDTFSYQVYNVDRKDITKYAFDAQTVKLYSETGAESYVAANVYGNKVAYAMEYKIRGFYGSIKTLLPTTDAVVFSISDTSKFDLSLSKNAQSVKVYAKTLGNDTSATANLSATIKGYNNVYTVVNADPVVSDKTVPAAASITVSRNDFTTLTNIGTDYYEVTEAIFDTLISGKYLTKYVASTDMTVAATDRSEIYFASKDQYGKDGADFAQILVTKTNAAGSTSTNYDVTDGKLPTIDSAAGDYFKITLIAANGLSKTVTVIVK